MRCPVCSNQDTKVIDSRVTGNGHSIRRRRECVECAYRFSTLEAVEILDLTLNKRDGRKEPYVREKLEAGLRKALEKREHAEEGFRELVSAIEVDIQRLRRSELDSGALGEIVMTHLKEFDTVAYIRFASVYRCFEDVETFQTELSKLSRTIASRQKKAKAE